MNKNNKIFIKLEKNYFFPGESIIGNLYLKLQTSVKSKGINLTFKGKQIVQYKKNLNNEYNNNIIIKNYTEKTTTDKIISENGTKNNSISKNNKNSDSKNSKSNSNNNDMNNNTNDMTNNNINNNNKNNNNNNISNNNMDNNNSNNSNNTSNNNNSSNNSNNNINSNNNNSNNNNNINNNNNSNINSNSNSNNLSKNNNITNSKNNINNNNKTNIEISNNNNNNKYNNNSSSSNNNSNSSSNNTSNSYTSSSTSNNNFVSFYNSNNNLSSKTGNISLVTENKEIIKNDFFINFASDEDDEIIENGSYLVPFEFKLPENKKDTISFPSSCLLSESNIYIEIIYLLKAYVLSDSKKIIKFCLPIMIRNYLEFFEYPQKYEEFIDVGTCCCERGLIKMIANVPYPNKNSYIYNKNNSNNDTNKSYNNNNNNDLFIIGEKVGINVCIDNEENKNYCDPISIKIYQKITLFNNNNLNSNYNNNSINKNFNFNNSKNNNKNNSKISNNNNIKNSIKSKNTSYNYSSNYNINTTYSDNENIILYKCIGKFEHYKKIPKRKIIDEKFFLYFKENIYTKDDDIKRSKYYKYIRHNLNYFSKLGCSVLSELAKIEYYYEISTFNDGWDYKELSIIIPFVMYPPEDIYKVLQKKFNEFNDVEIIKLNKQNFNIYFNSLNNPNKINDNSKNIKNNNNKNDNNINIINNNINKNNKIEMEINNSNVYNSIESSNRELFVNNKNIFINNNNKRKLNKKIKNFTINLVKNQLNNYDKI